MFLNSRDDPEVFRRLTGKRRHEAHARVLNAMGVQHRVRPDGVVVVSRDHVEHLLGARPDVARKEKPPEFGPIA